MSKIKECYADQSCKLSFVEFNRLLSLLQKNTWQRVQTTLACYNVAKKTLGFL